MMRTFPENAGRLYVESCPLRSGSDGERRLRLRFPPFRRCGRWGAMWVRVVAVAVRPCVASLVPPGNMASRWLFVQKAATNELMPAPFDEAERPQARLPDFAPGVFGTFRSFANGEQAVAAPEDAVLVGVGPCKFGPRSRFPAGGRCGLPLLLGLLLQRRRSGCDGVPPGFAAARGGRWRGARRLERGHHLFSSAVLRFGGFACCLFHATRSVCLQPARSAAHLTTI